MSSSVKIAYALVDWHNLTGYPSIVYGRDPRREIPKVIHKLQAQIARALATLGDGHRYRVITRIYHGWHREREPMPVRRDFELFATDTSLARRLNNAIFSPGFQFGNDLVCQDGAHSLYSTFRGGGQETGQKMIDTAIVCDSLHILRFGLADSTLIIGDDDDFIPVMLTARSWKSRLILLRKPGSGIVHATDATCAENLFFWSEE